MDRPRPVLRTTTGRPVRDGDRSTEVDPWATTGRSGCDEGTAEAVPGVACRRSEPRQRPKPRQWLRSPCLGAGGIGTDQLPAGRDRHRFPEGKVRRGRPVDAPCDDTPEGVTAVHGPVAVFRSPPRWGSGGHRGPCAGRIATTQGVCEGTIPRGSMTILAC